MTSTDLQGFLRSRRSVRRFRAHAVAEPLLERILATAACAPSAHNRQPWRFRVLTSLETRTCLADAMAADFRRDLARDGTPEHDITIQVERSRARITAAPVVIILCMDASDMKVYPDPIRIAAERTMAVQSVAAAGAQLLLAAHAEGLGGTWICWPLFAPETVAKALDLPASWEPQAMFFLGYPAGEPKSKSLRPLSEITRFDHP